MDLTDWLLEQITEDERQVRGPGRPSILGLPRRWIGRVWLPQRIRTECEAKRRRIELHTGAHDCTEIHTGVYSQDWPVGARYGAPGATWRHASQEHFEADEPCETLRAEALPYADRPGYREEWRP